MRHGLLAIVFCLAATACAMARELPSPETVLDDFHDAAARADEPRYFGHFAADGVFLGTDQTERWTVAEFRAYAHPHFAKDRGWTYVPKVRHMGRDGGYAWFDEVLENEAYGFVRGSGLLRQTPEGWKIVQYNLTFLVPNDAAEDVVARIRRE